MGDFAKWLLHEDQKEFFDYLFAIAVNAAFLILIALLLWPLGKAAMAWRFTKAYWILVFSGSSNASNSFGRSKRAS